MFATPPVLRLVAMAAALAATHAESATIQQDQRSGIFQVQFYSPIGQSFTAVEPGLLSIGFAIGAINAHFPRVEIGVRLRDGDGMGGTVIAERVALPDPIVGLTQYFDWNFAGVSLVAGHVYTAELFSGNPYWGVDAAFADATDPYAGGRAHSQGHTGLDFAGNRHEADLRFRVIGSAVPEPQSFALLLAGLGAGGLWVRRRQVARPA